MTVFTNSTHSATEAGRVSGAQRMPHLRCRRARSQLGSLNGRAANVGGKRDAGLLDSPSEDRQATWELNGGHAVLTVRGCNRHGIC